MSDTKILPCTCKQDYQDEAYGRGKRVHNATAVKLSNGEFKYRCTGCGTERTA